MSDAFLDELRGRFRDSARTRVATMRTLLDALETNPDDADAVRALMRHFHFFAGMGTTCGFSAVSAIGDEGEALLQRLVHEALVPDADALAACRRMVAQIEQELRD